MKTQFLMWTDQILELGNSFKAMNIRLKKLEGRQTTQEDERSFPVIGVQKIMPRLSEPEMVVQSIQNEGIPKKLGAF